MLSDYQIDLLDFVRHMDLNNPKWEQINHISDKDIVWLIDHFDLTKHDTKIFGMRYLWEYDNFSRKQRWMVIAESHKKEKDLFTI